MFEPAWHRPVKIVLVTLALAGGYAWVSAEDWEMEIEAEQIQLAQARRDIQIPELPPELEVDPTPEYREPEPPIPHPLVSAHKSVKKAAVKTKKRVKKAFKPKQ
jgi:hypothetical protein